MQVCEHCGREQDQFDRHGNEVWNCPKDCDFEKAAYEVNAEIAAKSDEQLAAEAEDMGDEMMDD